MKLLGWKKKRFDLEHPSKLIIPTISEVVTKNLYGERVMHVITLYIFLSDIIEKGEDRNVRKRD